MHIRFGACGRRSIGVPAASGTSLDFVAYDLVRDTVCGERSSLRQIFRAFKKISFIGYCA